ncbi:MAG: hypothetical protein ACRYE9_03325 [Janthinobacterium lividum]
MSRIYIILALSIMVTSCSKNIQQKIGVVTSGPDEYKVQRAKALEVPPHYELPLPYSSHNSLPNVKSKNNSNLNDGEKELTKEMELK